MTKSNRGRDCGLRLGADLGSLIALEGCVGAGTYGWGLSYVISDPASYNKALVKGVLRQLNIGFNGPVILQRSPGRLALIGAHESKPLSELVHYMLKKSDNVIAAALFKKLGQLYFRQQGSWENGSLAVSRILNKSTRMSTLGLRITDGSGLSKENLITSAQMMHALDYAFHQPRVGDTLYAGLPIAGVDGTLKMRMGHLGRRVHAKTGTISGVVSLAGYAIAANQEPLAFVIIVNGQRGLGWRYKSMEDKLVTALTKFNRT
jgi:D-alanyl-D-alanine carboxypeptidase/D-alanyl-D-alanine-endopeptidase (penicillin-binding protein 4)